MLLRRVPAYLVATSSRISPLPFNAAFPDGRTDPLHGPAASREMSSLITHIIPKGHGGRSSVSGVVATVFGATGFLGRYVVQQLAKVGSQVFIPYRGEYDHQRHLRLMGDLGQIVPVKFDVRDEAQIRQALAKSNVVINLLGSDFETRNFSFDDIHVKAAANIAKISKEADISRFIHVSCLGASPSAPSKFHRTKAAGEAAVQEIFPKATILRPAAMFGTEDRLLNRLATLIKKMPFLPIIDGGLTRLQPVHVHDVAAGLVAALKDLESEGAVYELGGPDVLTIRDLVDITYETIRERPRIVSVPAALAQLGAMPLEVVRKIVPLPIPSPILFSKDYIDSLKVDYLVSPDALTFKDLGIVPRKLQGTAIDYLFSFRTGGPNFGSTKGERVAGAGF